MLDPNNSPQKHDSLTTWICEVEADQSLDGLINSIMEYQ